MVISLLSVLTGMTVAASTSGPVAMATVVCLQAITSNHTTGYSAASFGQVLGFADNAMTHSWQLQENSDFTHAL